jgi:HK97 gp10 family phage protein
MARKRNLSHKSGFSFEGAEMIDRILSALPQALGPKAVADALKSAAKPLIKQAKANVSDNDHTGNLKRSIGAIHGRGLGRQQQIYVGPRRGKGANALGYHGHLVEYGTGPRKLVSKKIMKSKAGQFFGTEVGPMPATPFLRPAWDATNAQVQSEMLKNLRNILDSNFKNVKF